MQGNSRHGFGRHASDQHVALYSSGDLSLWHSPLERWHIAHCSRCRERAAVYAQDRSQFAEGICEIPDSISWQHLASEMTANIHLGLAAGQCVAPRHFKRESSMGWRVAAAASGFLVLLVVAWWLNTPPATTASLERAMRSIARGPWGAERSPMAAWRSRAADSVPTVRATADGIRVSENGNSLGLSQGSDRPRAVTLSVKSARAQYVDAETGQVTITSVYVQ